MSGVWLDAVGLRPPSIRRRPQNRIRDRKAFQNRLSGDRGAGQRIRARIVVLQRDAELARHISKIGRLEFEMRAGDPHRAGKRRCRLRLAGHAAAGKEHLAIERGVVRDQIVGIGPMALQIVPDLAELRLAAHVVPGEAVDIGEDEFFPRRPDQPGLGFGDLAVLDRHDAERAGAVGAEVGGLKIDGDDFHG
jgi:hypothetical protein